MPARILIVEDDGVVAETLEAYLQQTGYEVTRVRDGGRYWIQVAGS